MVGLGLTDTRGYLHELERHGDFVTTGIKLFDSEDVTDSLLRMYLSLSTKGWMASHPDIPMAITDFVEIYKDGLWLPCVERVAISGQVDARNDGLPNFAAIPIAGDTEFKFDFAIAKRLQKLPRGWQSMPMANAAYSLGFLYRGHGGRESRRRLSDDILYYDGWYFNVIGDRILPCKKQYFPNGGPAGKVALYGSAALQITSDFRHMWVVTTEENALDSVKTPLRLGVDSEMIKSLFYAREAPITESGRKRPILHWVRQHKRRMKEGIDVDISKHLRGITAFSMDGFPFVITQPIKNIQ